MSLRAQVQEEEKRFLNIQMAIMENLVVKEEKENLSRLMETFSAFPVVIRTSRELCQSSNDMTVLFNTASKTKAAFRKVTMYASELVFVACEE